MLKVHLIKTMTFVMFLSLLPTITSAESSHEKLKHYKGQIRYSLEQTGKNMINGWQYQQNKQQTIDGEKETCVAIYTPNRTQQQWELISFNSAKPTPEKIIDFAKEKQQEWEDNQALFGETETHYKFLSFIDEASLQLESTNADLLTFSFNGKNKKFSDVANEKLKGTLVLNAKTGFVKNLQVKNLSYFTIKLLFKVKHWQVDFTFRQTNGTPMLIKQESKLRGTIGFFADINVSSSVVTTNFVNKAQSPTL